MKNPFLYPLLTRRVWLSGGLFVGFAYFFVLYVQSEKQIDHANYLRFQSFLLADELRQSSDDLSRMARSFVVTGKPSYKAYYQEILDIRNGLIPRPEGYQFYYWDMVTSYKKPSRFNFQSAIPLIELMREAGFSAMEFSKLEESKANSDALTAIEFEAMRLASTVGADAESQRDKAIKMLFDDRYNQAKATIIKPIGEFYEMLDQRTFEAIHRAEHWAEVFRYWVALIGLALVVMVWNTYKLWRATLDGIIFDRQRGIVALRESEQKLKAVVDILPIGLWILDEKGEIISTNLAAEKIWHGKRHIGIGHYAEYRAWWPSGKLIGQEEWAAARALGQGETTLDEQIEIECFDGTHKIILNSALPLRESDGRITGAVVLNRDITEIKQNEEALQRIQTLLNETGKMAHVGGWEIDIASKELIWTEEVYRIHEVDSTYRPIVSSGIAFYSPESRLILEKAIQRAITQGEPFSLELQFITAKGNRRWVHSVGKADHDRGKVLGAFQDITERKFGEDALLFLAKSGGQTTGQGFFESLAINLAEKLHMDFVCIDRLEGDGLNARTLAVWNNGKFEDNIVYALRDTPCGDVVGKVICCFPTSVCQLFPKDEVLKNLNAESYVGATLWSHIGKPIGLIALIGQKTLQNRPLAEAVLKIVAVRAGAELERLETERALMESEKLYRSLFDNMLNGFAYCQVLFEHGQPVDFIYLSVNNAFETLTGLNHVEGKKISEVIPGIRESDPEFFEIYGRVALTGVTERVEIFLNALGIWFSIAIYSPCPEHFVAIFEDITDRKRAENEIKQLAFYDALTGLPNRRLLLDRLRLALISSVRTQRSGALLFIDLDNFKVLNDNFGHDQGDLLLQQVAQRLMSCVRESDTVARMGGDEFLVMLVDLSDKPQEAAIQAESVGEKILAMLNLPYFLGSHKHHSSTSIGITLFEGQKFSVEDLLKQSDLAMYQAKSAGRNTLRFFNPDMQEALEARATLEKELREGLKNEHFRVYYQPQVDHRGVLTGAEALVRWQHPGHGLMSPCEFIALAEDTGLILPLGNWVLETVCVLLARWAGREQTSSLSLAVNVCARQFRAPDFVSQVLRVLEQTGANPQRLKLELTESLLLDNVEDTIVKMKALKAHGVSFSLDDFGIGYSSLSYLKRLPLDQLKIDVSFVRDSLTDPNDAAIVRTIVALGQTLGLGVIAEGVETESQRDFLVQLGCHAFQGHLFGRPVPLEELLVA